MAERAVVEIPTKRWGTGTRAVLLIHGLSAHKGIWWRIGPILGALGFEVVAIDLRGHGESLAGSDYSLLDVASDVLAVPGRWDLVIGHSMGGPIATVVAVKSGCQRLLLLDPFFDVEDDQFEDLLADQLGELDSADVEAIQQSNPRWHAEDCRQKAIAIELTSREVIEGYMRHNHPFHFRTLLEDCDAETLILGSDPAEGSLFPPHTMHHIQNRKVAYRMLTGCGHSIPRERPDAVIAAVRDLMFPNPGF